MWEQVSSEKVLTFSSHVKETNDAIERSALLIEDDHYQKLKAIIKQFENFQFGKQRLVDLRHQYVQQVDVDDSEIRYTIDRNRQNKEDFTLLLNELRSHFKKQICGENIAN